MQVADTLMMFSMAVSDMPKAKAFYLDKLGFKVATDYRKDDDNWWVSLTLPKMWGFYYPYHRSRKHEARHDEAVLCDFRRCRRPRGAQRKRR